MDQGVTQSSYVSKGFKHLCHVYTQYHSVELCIFTTELQQCYILLIYSISTLLQFHFIALYDCMDQRVKFIVIMYVVVFDALLTIVRRPIQRLYKVQTCRVLQACSHNRNFVLCHIQSKLCMEKFYRGFQVTLMASLKRKVLLYVRSSPPLLVLNAKTAYSNPILPYQQMLMLTTGNGRGI